MNTSIFASYSFAMMAILFLSAPSSLAEGGSFKGQPLPKMLTGKFFKKKDVVADAVRRGKRYAVVLVKTHHCDGMSSVCLRSDRTVMDPVIGRIFQDSALYQTRFNDVAVTNSPDGSCQPEYRDRVFSDTTTIRNEWNKRDSNPELIIIDTQTGMQIGREFLKNYLGTYSEDNTERRVATVQFLSSMPQVAEAYKMPKKMGKWAAKSFLSKLFATNPDLKSQKGWNISDGDLVRLLGAIDSNDPRR